MFVKFAIVTFVLLSTLVVEVHNHVMMKSPPTRQAIMAKTDGIWWNFAPLFGYPNAVDDVKRFPCGSNTASEISYFSSGQTIPVVLATVNNHGGGDCQFALAYTNDTAYVVIHTVFRTCMQNIDNEKTYPVTLPNNLPGGKAIFCMSFIPAEADEYYHSCADIWINGERRGSVTGKMLVVVNYDPNADIHALSGGVNGDLVHTAPDLTVHVEGDEVTVTPPELRKSNPLKVNDPLLQLFKRTGTSTNSNNAGNASNALPPSSTAVQNKLRTGETAYPKPPSPQTPPAYAAPPPPIVPLTSTPAKPPGYDSVPLAPESPKPNGASEYPAPETPAVVPSAPTPDQLSLSAAPPMPPPASPAKDVDNGYSTPPAASEPSDDLNPPAPPKEDKAVPPCDLKTTSVETDESNASRRRNGNVARYLAAFLASIAGLSYLF